MNNSISPTFLDPHERALLIKLMDTVENLAKCMENRLPPFIGKMHWMKSKHSPNAWADVFWSYLQPDQSDLHTLTKLELEALSIRATLAEIAILSQSALRRSEEAVMPAPNLDLAKKKRVEI